MPRRYSRNTGTLSKDKGLPERGGGGGGVGWILAWASTVPFRQHSEDKRGKLPGKTGGKRMSAAETHR